MQTLIQLSQNLYWLSNVWGDRWQVVIAGNMVMCAIPQLVGASVNPIPVVNIFGGNPHSYWEKLNVVFKLTLQCYSQSETKFPLKTISFLPYNPKA